MPDTPAPLSPRMRRTRNAWRAMLGRCNDRKNLVYYRYGGRGISICPQWRTFKGFLVDMGLAPLRMTLDRIDNNGNYEPGNCRWISHQEQQWNRRDNVKIRYQNKDLTVRDFYPIAFGKRYRVDNLAELIRRRWQAGWSAEQIISGWGPNRAPVGMGKHG